ncbi:MAG: nucleotidyltransferase domain-containing protein [Gammaproteobacteria bacterium]|nr:nucleotidyltransferase domain-containing protein [Gammaproteobacteria bacterium]
MGINISDALFSKTQQRLLGLLFGQPHRTYYLKELITLANIGRGTVQRELKILEGAGLVNVTRRGNQKHFQANPFSPIFHELNSIAIKTFGIADVIREKLQSFDNGIEYAFIYGSIAKGEEIASSDIDLFVVSDSLAYSELMGVLVETEEMLGRTVNSSIYSPMDIIKKLGEGNAFITRVMEQAKIWIKGNDDDIREFRQSD